MPNSGTIGNVEVTVNRLIVIQARVNVILKQSSHMMLIYQEIRDRSFYLKSGCCSDRASADMQLYGNIVHMRHITNFLSFGNAAGIAWVRLNDLQCIKYITRPPQTGTNALKNLFTIRRSF